MTNEVIQNIITRRSIKQYKDQQITDEELQTVLDAGLYAPSGMGMQSPVMVVVQDKDTMAQIVRMNAAVMNATSNPYYDAPTVILVLAPTDRTTYIEDASCVLDTMMLADPQRTSDVRNRRRQGAHEEMGYPGKLCRCRSTGSRIC